ncbi:MAG: hypothetical protein J5806_07745 [Lentisphaeria bacterium]|nr:hypothetical protein [Lentisphaeria bacterium]
MKKWLLTLLWCAVGLILSGCIVYGSKTPFCTPEESIEDNAFLFPVGTPYFIGWKQDRNSPQSIASARLLPQEKRYRYVLLAKDEKTGKMAAQENKPMLVRYFRHDGLYYADLQFVDPDPEVKPLTELHHLCLVGVLGDRVVFTSYGPWLAKDEQWESCEHYDVVKDDKGKLQRLVYKGTPAQLKEKIGTVLHPVIIFTGQLPHQPLPEKADGIFSRKYREKFLLHFIRLQQDWLQNRGKTSKGDFDQAIGFIEKILNEDGSKKLSPKVIAEAKKLIAEQKRLIAEQFKKQ